MKWEVKKTVDFSNEDKEFFEDFYGIDLSSLTPELIERLINYRKEENFKELLILAKEILKTQANQVMLQNEG
jgi:hypothetical protein